MREDPPPTRRRRLRAAAALGVLALLLTACGGGGGGGGAEPDEDPAEPGDNLFAAMPQYVDPDSTAAAAAAKAEERGDTDSASVFSRMAKVPTGIWLTPEAFPPGAVGPRVADIEAAADAADEVALLVVYGIPDRDCSGGFSAGGLSEDQYGPWVGEIADAAAGSPYVAIVLEPDALASAVGCDRRDQRVTLLRDAVDRLAEAEVTTYVDGGHSDWVPAQEVAGLLQEVGVEQVRGFSTNVSNFQADQAELDYAQELSSLVGGADFVIDRSRNGNGATKDWCNPPLRALGEEPEAVGDGGLDAWLWIKPPGESDGTCGGGPPAGTFWPERALELASAAGW